MWYLLEKISYFSHLLTVLMIFLVAIFWLKFHFSKISLMSFLGALLAFSGVASRLVVSEVQSINVGHVEPLSTNPLLWSVYMYGFNIGLAIFVMALVVRLKKD